MGFFPNFRHTQFLPCPINDTEQHIFSGDTEQALKECLSILYCSLKFLTSSYLVLIYTMKCSYLVCTYLLFEKLKMSHLVYNCLLANYARRNVFHKVSPEQEQQQQQQQQEQNNL